MDALAVAAAISAAMWTHPGGDMACNRFAENPCWTDALVASEALEARASGRGEPDRICDGDLIRNTGARDGRGFATGLLTASFSEDWLRERGYRYTVDADGTVCIPAMNWAGTLEAEACANAITIERRAIERLGFISPYMHGGSSPALTRTGGGASAHVASPHIPAVPLPTSAALLLGALAWLAAMGFRNNRWR